MGWVDGYLLTSIIGRPVTRLSLLFFQFLSGLFPGSYCFIL